MSVPHSLISQLVKLALDEDLNYQSANDGDITAQLIPENEQANAKVITREDCVFCGKDIILEVFKQVDESVKVDVLVNDGDTVIVNVIAFADKVRAGLLALEDGESVALSGSLTPKVWTDKNGDTRPALDLVAHAMLSAHGQQD